MADRRATFSDILATGKSVENIEIVGQVPGAPGEEHTWLASYYPTRTNDGYIDGLALIVTEITDRKRTETRLAASEQRFRSLFENMLEGFAYCEAIYGPAGNLVDWVYLEVNNSFDRLTGLTGVKGRRVSEILPDLLIDNPEVFDIYGSVAMTGKPADFETWVPSLKKWLSISVFSPAKDHFVAVFEDITERKRNEAAMEESEERYRGIFDHANEGIVRTTFEGKLITLNRRFAEIMGYASPERLINEIGNFKGLYFNLGDRGELVRGLRELGTISDHELRLKKRDGSTIWTSINISTTTNPETGEKFLDGLVVDISRRKAAEDKLRKSHHNLEESLLGLVSTLALTVETRDPYTAEHQRRVTELAVAIANEAKFSANDIASLRMAATIHDVGKIFVPAETLNKPGKVSAIEFELIKTHAAAGYNIIKDVKFDEPIAEIVHQHHERMDGSGYPDGLKGDEIHARARIVAIADVVEAMSSHRPYRPALGTKAALAEIEQNSGTLYDPTYAAICLKLFRKKHFEFK